MSKLYELSRVIMPNGAFLPLYEELFIRRKEKMCMFGEALTNVNVYEFDTWMNAFSSKIYHTYCDLGKLYLSLDIEGSYKVVVFGSELNDVFSRIDTTLLEQDCSGKSVIEIPNPAAYDGIAFKIFEAKDKPIKIKGGAWCTDKEPLRDNKLAVITCTFKREEYVTRNIALFENFLKENPSLKHKMKYILSDNGKTLPASLNSDNVNIHPNINAGGAGGFTRGIIEALHDKETFDRVLLMDDDVEIFPESFYRVLLMSDYLKEEHKDAFINGAMVNLYNKDMYFETIAVDNNYWVAHYYPPRSLFEYTNVLQVLNIPQGVQQGALGMKSAGWWYCSFAVDTIKDRGLPLPFFIRSDDLEWSFRNNDKAFIWLNGVNVWHAPFEWRCSKVMEIYFTIRNVFFARMLHTKDFKKNFRKWFWTRLNNVISTYDYTSAELFIMALEDILKGPDAFKVNPEEKFKELNAVQKQVKYIDCFDKAELEEVFYKKVHKVAGWRKFLYRITTRGLHCPDCFYEKEGKAIEWYPPVPDFIMIKEVKVYNVLTGKYEVRKLDKKKSLFYRQKGKALLDEIYNRYEELEKKAKTAFAEFTTEEFWRDYLGLDK
ncbi:MAG: hypothetical protein IKN71_07075 [Alphaproteobacteria bacterium]|nr:hypothetical protein [Alphaproteobacteria bacterium]